MNDPRSEAAMEAERRDLERALINRTRRDHPTGRPAERSERFTNPAEALAALRESMRARPALPGKPVACHRCEDSGWEELRDGGRGLVGRCSNGCEPPRRLRADAEPTPAPIAGGSFE